MLKAFCLPTWISEGEFATWLTQEADHQDELLNMHVVALWAYAIRAGEGWYSYVMEIFMCAIV